MSIAAQIRVREFNTGQHTYSTSVFLCFLFLLIDLHHVEQEADGNLHLCVCVNYYHTVSQIFWTTVQLVVLSQHVEVTALVLVPDLHLVVATESNTNLSLHLIVSECSRFGFGFPAASPHSEHIVFVRHVFLIKWCLFGRVQQAWWWIFLLCTDSGSANSYPNSNLIGTWADCM